MKMKVVKVPTLKEINFNSSFISDTTYKTHYGDTISWEEIYYFFENSEWKNPENSNDSSFDKAVEYKAIKMT